MMNNKLRGLREMWHFDNRIYLILSRILFPNQSGHIYRVKDVEFLSDHRSGDANGARELLTTPMYRKYIEKMNLRGDIKVLDIGSNNGGFPLLLKTENVSIGQLVCVELNPNTFVRLQFNLGLNFNGRFQAFNLGICGENRELRVKLGAGSAGDNIYGSADKNDSDQIVIPGRTLDDVYDEVFGEQVVDLCKIDIEGAEYEVFGSETARSISRCRYLLIEIHNSAERPRKLVLDKLTAAGFKEIDGENKVDDLHYVHFLINQKLAADGETPYQEITNIGVNSG